VAAEVTIASSEFVNDVRASLAAWSKVPLLPIVTACLAAITTVATNVSGPWVLVGGLVAVPVGAISLGWLGTQFVWYRAAFHGHTLGAGELVKLTWSFIARYVRLFFLMLIPLFGVVFVSVFWRTWTSASPGWRIGGLAYSLVLSTVVTFVNPALAFSTRRVTKAVPIGLRMVAQGWPGNWTYVVVPGIVAALGGGLYWLVPSAGRPASLIVTTVITLVFAGAIARYYLRCPLAPGGQDVPPSPN